MSLQHHTLRLAASLPKGSPTRRALLACLCEHEHELRPLTEGELAQLEEGETAELDSGAALARRVANRYAAPEGDATFDPYTLTLFEAKTLKLPNWKKAVPSAEVSKAATAFILATAKLTAVYNQQNPKTPLTVNPTHAYLALHAQPQALKFPQKFLTLLQNLTRQSLKTLKATLVESALATGA